MSSYQTALALVLPEHLWPAVQAIRSQHDKAYPRWPPHITLAFPFVTPDQLPAVEATVATAALSCSPFTVTLDDFGYFQHRADRSTLYVSPTQPQPTIDLHSALATALQLPTDRPFTPHLTLGQFGDEADTLDNLGRIQMSWEPLQWQCTDVCILQKDMETGHFSVHSRLPLGGSETTDKVSQGPKLIIMSDRTGSMGGFLSSVQQTMKQLSAISQLLFQGKLHVGLLVYGDYDSPVDHVVAWSGYCTDLKQLKQFIQEEVRVRWSGGDTPEAQKTAFNYLLPLVDQETLVFHYTDAPPHHESNWNSGGLGPKERNHLKQQQLETDWVRLCQAISNTGAHMLTVCNTSAFNVVTYYMLLGPVMKLTGVTPENVLQLTMVALQQMMGIEGCTYALDTSQIVWAHPPQLGALLGETQCQGYLPGSPLRQDIKVHPPLMDPLPWLKADLKGMSRQFHQDANFRETCFAAFEHLLQDSSLVMCLTYNDVFGTLWRQICKCRDDARREQLVDALGACCQKLSSQNSTTLRAWIDRSYNSEEEIKELIASAPRPSPCIYTAAPASFTRDDMMNLARGNLSRETLTKLAELLTELLESPADSDCDTGVPLSLSNKNLFSVLPHLFCPGLQFSLRPSMIMAILAYTLEVAPLKERALAFLQQQRGKWINVSKKGDEDGVYAVPENFSGQFVDLISKLLDKPDTLLTPQEQQLYGQLSQIHKLQQNGRKPFTVQVGVTPKGQLLPDTTVQCSRCQRHRSVSIMAQLGDAPICGLCHYNIPADTYPVGPGEGKSHLYSCCTCGSLYAVVDTEHLRVRPKCHWCRQQTALARIPRVHCRSCGNHFLVPSMPDKEAAHIEVCTLCAEAPAEAVVEKVVTLRELAEENPSVVRLFGMPDAAAATLFDNQIGSLLKRYTKLQPMLDNARDDTGIPAFTYQGKRVLNMANLQQQLEQEILHGSTFQDCSLCFSSLPVNSLDSACGKCENRVCPQCRKRWYSQCSPGNVVFESHLCCPFCKQKPTYSVLKRSNKRLAEIVKRTQPFQPGQWYAWCSRCYVIKDAAARECARQPPDYRGSFCCAECQDRKPDTAKLCPRCGIATEKAGGCNHITCAACHAHWCWLCGEASFSVDEQDTGGAGDIYHHLYTVHGGYGFGDV